jgi:hypothetical protein
MKFKLKKKNCWVELTVINNTTTTTEDFSYGKQINDLIQNLEEIIEELKLQQDNEKLN